MEFRKCKSCKQEKTLSKFHKTTTGYRGSCRVCYNQTVGAKANLKMKNRRKDPAKVAFFIGLFVNWTGGIHRNSSSS